MNDPKTYTCSKCDQETPWDRPHVCPNGSGASTCSRPSVNDIYLACKALPYDFDEMDHRDIILGIVEKCHEMMIENG